MSNNFSSIIKARIQKYASNVSFSEEGIDELKKMSKHVIDWPVVYILNGDKEAYIGETQSAVDRMNQHVAHKSSTRNNLA